MNFQKDTECSSEVFSNICMHTYVYIQGVLLPDRQTLRGDSRHEDKHY